MTMSIPLVIIVSVCLLGGVGAATFTKQPNDAHVDVGDRVECLCEYTGSDNLPYWNISGKVFPPFRTPPYCSVNERGLYFTARPFLNLTTYQCIVDSQGSRSGRVFVRQSGEDSPDADHCACQTYIAGAEMDGNNLTLWISFKPKLPPSSKDALSTTTCYSNVRYCYQYESETQVCEKVGDDSELKNITVSTKSGSDSDHSFIFSFDNSSSDCQLKNENTKKFSITAKPMLIGSVKYDEQGRSMIIIGENPCAHDLFPDTTPTISVIYNETKYVTLDNGTMSPHLHSELDDSGLRFCDIQKYDLCSNQIEPESLFVTVICRSDDHEVIVAFSGSGTSSMAVMWSLISFLTILVYSCV